MPDNNASEPLAKSLTLKSLVAVSLDLTPDWMVKAIEWEIPYAAIRIQVTQRHKTGWRCIVCEKEAPHYDTLAKTWRHLDLWALPTWIHSNIPRTKCMDHGVHTVRVPWSDPRSRLTRPLTARATKLLSNHSVSAVASMLGMSWDQAKRLKHHRSTP